MRRQARRALIGSWLQHAWVRATQTWRTGGACPHLGAFPPVVGFTLSEPTLAPFVARAPPPRSYVHARQTQTDRRLTVAEQLVQ